MAILPSPFGSQAKPMRGAGLKRWPFKQPASLEDPTAAAPKRLDTSAGTKVVPPGPPHWMMPLKGLPLGLPKPEGSLFGMKAPEDPVTEPSRSIVGELAALKAVGSKLKVCLYRSR